jgi:hypothetical protein
MGFDFTNTNLLDDVKRRTFMPANQITYSDEDILHYADEELQIGIVPLLMSVREDYFVAYIDTTIDANTAGYDIPERAIGTKLKDVTVIETTALNTPPGSIVEISIPRIQSDQGPTRMLNNYPGFYVRENQIILQNPNAFDGKFLRQYYFKRPKLVPVTQGSKITALGPQVFTPVLAANQVVVDFVPPGFGSSNTVDLIQAKPGFRTVLMDLPITCSGLVITFTSLTTLPTNLQIGDWICLAGETTIPQIPVELHPILAQRVAVKVLEGLGDVTNLQAAQVKLKEAEHSVLMMISNRVEGEPQKIVNPYSCLRVFPWRRY